MACKFCNDTGTVLNQFDNTEDCPVCRNRPLLVLTTNQKLKRRCIVLTCNDNRKGICYADETCSWLKEINEGQLHHS